MMRVSPSLLSSDFCRLGEEIAAVQRGGAEALHLDVMDGHFVPNLSLGVPVVESVARCTSLSLDTHLMITDPARYAAAFAAAGSGSITFHIEVVDQPRALVDLLHKLGVRAGVALNPSTPASRAFDLLEMVDLVLVMTVWPGFGGQAFLEECLPKVEALAQRMRADQWLQVDGGINLETAEQAAAAGANNLVAGNAVFRTPDAAAAVQSLTAAAQRGASRRADLRA